MPLQFSANRNIGGGLRPALLPTLAAVCLLCSLGFLIFLPPRVEAGPPPASSGGEIGFPMPLKPQVAFTQTVPLVWRDVPYATLPGVDQNLTSLDIYAPANAAGRPVMVMIHGGGWKDGDKANPGVAYHKSNFFTANGYVFVSINYRLSPAIQHPVHAQDVAQALAFIHRHIVAYGGDPHQIFVMGHSAGAHLAALTAIDPVYLEQTGHDLSLVQGVILLDGAGYDIPALLEAQPALLALYEIPFGTDPETHRAASPITHVVPCQDIPPFLVMHVASRTTSTAQSNKLVAALRAAGVRADLFSARDKDHGTINTEFGSPDKPNDPPTVEAMAFLASLRDPGAAIGPPPPVFTADYTPGAVDPQGVFHGGTETTWLVDHQGQLFAGVGYWRDAPDPAEPQPGPQVLGKACAGCAWVVDHSWGGDYTRIDAMASITFTTDKEGRLLDSPQNLVVVSVSHTTLPRRTSVWTRRDADGSWQESVIVEGSARPYARFLADYTDKVTGIDHIFAGAADGALYRGAYDPDAPGLIAWTAAPELTGQERLHAHAVANGDLYVTLGVVDDEPGRGGLFRRIDGPAPRWEFIYEWPLSSATDRTKPGMRGLTAVPDPTGGDCQVLLGAVEDSGLIYRIDPCRGHQVTVELDVKTYFTRLWGGLGGAATLIAYNRFTPFTLPSTQEPAHLAGLWVNHPDKQTGGHLGQAAWFLLRDRQGDYTHYRVFDPYHTPDLTWGLRGVRTIQVSPFPADRDRLVYFGGFDAGGQDLKHNTAWIYRADFSAGAPQSCETSAYLPLIAR